MIHINNRRAVYSESCTYGSEGGFQKPTVEKRQGVGCLPNRTNLPHPPISIARGDRLTWNSASAEASGKATKMQRFTSTVS